LCLLLAAGCDGGSTTISTQVLAGKIGGQPWTFVQGEADAFLSDDSSYFVTLYGSSFTACATFSAPYDESHILISIPKTPGGYDLSLARNATFYVPPEDNLVATRGHVQIDESTATTITGGANITYDGDNTVDGQFQVSICP
jgi:hypothetical protein